MAPQSAETTRIIPRIPVNLALVTQAIAVGDMPNPCYLLWAGAAMIKVSDMGQTVTQIQVCGEPGSQSPNACHPYVCESRVEGDDYKISRSFQCRDESDIKDDLEENNFVNIELVDNQEDWFPRLQYYFEL